MARHIRNRLSLDSVQKFVTLVIGAVDAIAELLDAISRIH